tara:strand:- start:1344 stop:1490 length:147 start_codon:yes stop_codon:yes gene_type:complete
MSGTIYKKSYQFTDAGLLSDGMMHNQKSLSKSDLNKHRHFNEDPKDNF